MMHLERSQSAAVLEKAASEFVDWRPRIFGVAYRILGSACEAEDIVQEVWVRWQTTDRTVVKTRQRSSLRRPHDWRSTSPDPPGRAEKRTSIVADEPVDTSAAPELGAEQGEALELAVLHLLEKLTPNGTSRVRPPRSVRLFLWADRVHPSSH